MKIAINVQTILKDKMEGLGWFSYESIKRIIQQHPEHQFLLIFSKGIVPEFLSFDNVETVNIGPPFYRPLALYLKFEYLLPYYLKKHKIDLFISTDGISSVKIKTKQLLVIHDLNFEENSQWINKSFANYYKKYLMEKKRKRLGKGLSALIHTNLDDLDKEETFREYSAFGFENKELVWDYIGGKIGDMVILFEEKKQGYNEKKALERMLRDEVARLDR